MQIGHASHPGQEGKRVEEGQNAKTKLKHTLYIIH
uniref:Uncharacterized protein n=1 Tax=viral metagenome TaxID=1070528 RepID=A0A6C0FH19_9ZZZZ